MLSAMMQASRYGDEGVEGADAMGGAEGSGGEQDRNAGDGDSQLLQQNPEEEDGVSVLNEKDECDRHDVISSTTVDER